MTNNASNCGGSLLSLGTVKSAYPVPSAVMRACVEAAIAHDEPCLNTRNQHLHLYLHSLSRQQLTCLVGTRPLWRAVNWLLMSHTEIPHRRQWCLLMSVHKQERQKARRKNTQRP